MANSNLPPLPSPNPPYTGNPLNIHGSLGTGTGTSNVPYWNLHIYPGVPPTHWYGIDPIKDRHESVKAILEKELKSLRKKLWILSVVPWIPMHLINIVSLLIKHGLSPLSWIIWATLPSIWIAVAVFTYIKNRNEITAKIVAMVLKEE